MIQIIAMVLILLLVCWVISLLPIPAKAPPHLRNILYILVALVAICWLLDFAGIVHIGSGLPSKR